MKTCRLQTICVLVAILLCVASGCALPTLGAKQIDEAPAVATSDESPTAGHNEPTEKSAEALLAELEEYLQTAEAGAAADRAPEPDAQSVRRSQTASTVKTPPRETARENPHTDPRTPAESSSSTGAAVTNTVVSLDEEAPQKTGPAKPVVRDVRIRTANPMTMQNPEATQSKTNAPMQANAEPSTASAATLLEHLEKNASNAFGDQFRLRMAQLALGDVQKATQPAPGLPTEQAALIRQLVETAAAVRDFGAAPEAAGNEVLVRTRELHRYVGAMTSPVVSEVAFCRKVVGFGVYHEMSDTEFKPGVVNQTIVYGEVANLRSARDADGNFRTVLGTRLEVLTADGGSVWQHEEDEIVDTCRRQRSDFFLAQRVALPATMGTGDYVLKMFVEDKLSGLGHEAVLPFTITTPSLLTRGG